MTADKRHRESVVVAAGHEERLKALEKAAADPDGERARGMADRLLGEVLPEFDGDPEQLRRDADRLLGRPGATFGALALHGAGELTWDAIVATNRQAIALTGRDPDTTLVDSLFAPEVLARIDAGWDAFSSELDMRLDEEALSALIASCRRTVINAIVRPLGLGRLVARFDHLGGGVLTPHNAEKARLGSLDASDLANPTKALAYADRQNLAEDPARSRHGGRLFRDAPRDGTEDAYRDEPLVRPELDHVVAASVLDRDKRINFHHVGCKSRFACNRPTEDRRRPEIFTTEARRHGDTETRRTCDDVFSVSPW